MILDKIVRWAESESNVRLAILSGSRVREGEWDDLSDYDVALFARDPDALLGDDSWFYAFAPVLVVEKPEFLDDGSRDRITSLVVYRSEPRVDFMVLPLGRIETDLCASPLPDAYNVGYRVLVDKDGWSAHLTPPVNHGFIPVRPTAEEYATVVNDFWWETTAAAKYLHRGLVMAVKFYLEQSLRADMFRTMLGWYLGALSGWKVNPGQHQKGAQHLLPPDEWRALQATWVGPGIEENWEALFRMAGFFRMMARQVGEDLGHEYPAGLDADVVAYLKELRARSG